ncbi:MAG: hypothetical protein AB7Y46_02080 [Armatimonadota bacterium]
MIIGALAGCGCLTVVALLIAVQLGILGSLWFWQPSQPVPIDHPAEEPERPAPVTPDEPMMPEEPPSYEVPGSETPPPVSSPHSGGPGGEAAVRAALEAINEPGWVTRVQEHSADWRTVTVWAGPPQSEWVYEVTVQWDDGLGAYVLQRIADVPYP